MASEYILVCIEVFIILLSAMLSYHLHRFQNDRVISWAHLRIRMIWILVLLSVMILYIIEYNKGAPLNEIMGWFIAAIIMFFVFFIIEMFILNIIFGLFQRQKPYRLHFIKGVEEYLKTSSMDTLVNISSVLDTCFYFSCLLSLGSMIVALMTDYCVAYYHISTNIYLFDVGPFFIFVFIVLSGSLWLVSMLIKLIQLYDLSNQMTYSTDYVKRKQRQDLKEKIEFDKHSW